MWKWLSIFLVTLAVFIAAFAALWFVAYRRVLAEEAELARAPFAEALEKIRVKHRLPGIAAAAFHRGRIIEEAASGIRREGAPDRVTVGDQWHLGSCGKAMTATLAALLVEEGRVRWETPVAEALPGVPMDVGWRGVTFEQLFQHRSGMPEEPPDALWTAAWKRSGTPSQQRSAFVSGLLAAAPKHPPGSRFEYSNQGYALAGVMMERATGKPWEALMHERLFLPLGLASAGFGAPGKADAVTQPRGHTGRPGKLTPVEPGPDADNPPAIGSAGTVYMTIGDWARFAGWHAMRGQNSALRLRPENFARLHRPGPGQTYALGWDTVQRSWAGGTALTHAGSNTMWFALAWVAPEKEAAFVVATNAAHDKAFEACDAVIGQLVERVLGAGQ